MDPTRDDVPYETWEDVGRALGYRGNQSLWALGDWVRYGNMKYGRKYEQALAVTGFEYQTLADIRYVADRFQLSRRRENLSFQHHREVAPMDPAEQDDWLDLASANWWSSRELRERIREVRAGQKADTPEAEPAEEEQGEVVATVIRLSVPPEREQRWQQAAERVGKSLDDWIADTLDKAAGAWLDREVA